MVLTSMGERTVCWDRLGWDLPALDHPDQDVVVAVEHLLREKDLVAPLDGDDAFEARHDGFGHVENWDAGARDLFRRK